MSQDKGFFRKALDTIVEARGREASRVIERDYGRDFLPKGKERLR